MDEPRIKSRAEYMMDVVDDVVRGNLVPASFQRPYVWTRDDVEAMWKSILMGYPLGAILTWRRSGGSAGGATGLGPIRIQHDGIAEVILDGQNRLVTMAWSMTPPDEPVPEDASGYAMWRSGMTLAADPHGRRIMFMRDADITGMVMPVHHLKTGINPFLRRSQRDVVNDDAAAWLENLADRMRQSRMIRTTIERATIDQARDAFLHISRAGVPMSAEDFDAAMRFDVRETDT